MSDIAKARRQGRIRRHRRVRKKVHGTAARPRLAVYRSNKHISVQVIDDDAGATLAAASTVESDQRSLGGGGTVAAATRVGELIASAPRPPVSPRSCSTAVDSPITVVSLRSPKLPAPQVWSSDGLPAE